ncbi:hypothetical protein Tco_0175125 [Tanacetum coccineum]
MVRPHHLSSLPTSIADIETHKNSNFLYMVTPTMAVSNHIKPHATLFIHLAIEYLIYEEQEGCVFKILHKVSGRLTNSNGDNSRLMETLEALTIKTDSKFQSLKEEKHEMRKNYNNRGGDYASKNDDTPMCERHEANYIQSEELNNDLKKDLEEFKRCVHSMRTVHDKLFDRDDQSKTDLEKSITKFLDG